MEVPRVLNRRNFLVLFMEISKTLLSKSISILKSLLSPALLLPKISSLFCTAFFQTHKCYSTSHNISSFWSAEKLTYTRKQTLSTTSVALICLSWGHSSTGKCYRHAALFCEDPEVKQQEEREKRIFKNNDYYFSVIANSKCVKQQQSIMLTKPMGQMLMQQLHPVSP